MSTAADVRAGRARGLRTPSLRRRVTLTVLAFLAAMLLVLSVVADLVLGNRLEAQLRQRLVDRAGVASALVDQVSSRDLARRLEGEGVSAVVTTSDGQVYAEGPLGRTASSSGTGVPESPTTAGPGQGTRPAAGPSPPVPVRQAAEVVQRGDLLTVSTRLSDGSTLQLLADARDVRSTLDQVRLALALGALVVLLVAAALVPWIVSRTLRPLDEITEVAHSITRGDREQRLHPQQPRTELGRTAAAFDDMLDEVVGAEGRAVDSEARLRGFLSDAAHELRTPLTSVQAAAEHVLRDDPSTADREQLLVGLVRETRRAGRLVDDMLLMARIDRGLDLRRSRVDIGELAAQAVETRRLTHPEVSLSADGPPARAAVDPDRMAQVVGNLLDNALHVTSPGGRVTVLSWTDPSRGRVGLDVEDDGPGVPQEQRERIFERLVRLDEARSSRHGGAGLGLSIARGIIRAHGGDLYALDPAAGAGGARFRVELPAEPAPHPHSQPRPEPAPA